MTVGFHAENELDKTQDELERVQKLCMEKDRLTQQAAEDKRVLTGDLACKESEFRRVSEALDVNAAQTQAVTARYKRYISDPFFSGN